MILQTNFIGVMYLYTISVFFIHTPTRVFTTLKMSTVGLKCFFFFLPETVNATPSKKRYENNAQLNGGETYSVVVVEKLARTQQRITVALVDTHRFMYLLHIKQKTYI